MTEKKSFITEKIKNIPYSGIRRFFDVANEIEGAISLGVGEPDFDTPWAVRERAIYTIEKCRTVYTSNAGLPELRKEISKYLKNKINLDYDYKNQILVTVGASEGIDIALRAIIDQGDEVLLPEPSFVSYKPCIIMAGGTPVVITTKVENNFRLTPEEILEKITDKTKALILPYPNNPTGAIMEREDLEKIAKVLRERDIVVISDEIYSELTYGDRKHVSIAEIEGMYEKTIVLNGFSKSFAMTGWRLGYAAAPPDIISAMLKIHQYIIMCAPTISQYSAVEGLRSCEENVSKMRKEYDRRRRVMLKGFRDMGLECFEALGAFYLFPSISVTGMTSDEFCEKLLHEEKVAVVPGTALGDCGEGFIRCSYAYSIKDINAALDKIEKFVKKYKK
ncbi:MAG: aminotransferase class I/II-fold pyridoxal phosphate-dependent enzyme [Clostridiales bacterium]|jgi:aminotransferase|nr:aminotransferase class I/II-fold pyridoxal phosphate-dependent enzyme [Clostridiales bacterium]